MAAQKSKRKKVSSTPFSNFVRYASQDEKRAFFDKVITDSIAEQKEVIQKAELMKSIEECEQDLKNGDYIEIDDVDKHVEGLLKNTK